MSLPVLAYIADVPVEASYHGSALVYRMLQKYPQEKLCIVEASICSSVPARRLARVQYAKLDMGRPRWLSSRLQTLVSSWYTLRARGRASRIDGALDGFRPEAILTVAHGYSWLAAAGHAQAKDIPLHLIVHDDWPRQAHLLPSVRSWVDDQFGRVYREATSRLCVSRSMEESYRKRYGVGGAVLHPSRAADAQLYHEPPERVKGDANELVFAFGGTVNSPGYVSALRQLADALGASGGWLDLYGPISEADAMRAGLRLPNVRLRGLVKAEAFISTLRAEADVLFLPISFDAADRENMRLCFPSKLTDYTAAGVAILAYGPADSSGIRWVKENPGAAEIVEREDRGELASAVERLRSASHRHALGCAALRAGRESFSYERAAATFYGHLAGP